ncbi:MAG: arylsulfotransferase family protein [Bdellovibrionota bacterium]
MMKFILALLLLSTAYADSLKTEPLLVPPLDWKKYQFQANCTIFDIKNVKKVYPGDICHFLPDGSFISINMVSIRKFSPTKKVLWELPGHYHHQINSGPGNKSIFVLKSEITVKAGKRVRDDVFVNLDLDGKVIHQSSALKILKQAGVTPTEYAEAEILTRLHANYETSHFNSIYEIPENKYSKKYEWMKAGNIITNSYSLGIFILSPNLQKVIYHKELPFSNDHEFHDVQVTEKGEFLLFNNYRKAQGERDIPHSAIQKYDPVTDLLTFEFMPLNKELFYSPACGGIQEFPEFIFFSHITNGGYFYSKKEKKIILGLPGFAGDSRALVHTQQIKIVDVREFLRNSKD